MEDPLKLWRWKYVGSPFGSSVVVAFSGDRVIACNHSIFIPAKVGAEATLLRWGDDLAVDEKYRGQGIWGKLREYRSRHLGAEFKYTYSTTANPVVVKSWQERRREDFPFPVIRMGRIRDVWSYLEKRPVKNMILAFLGFSVLKTIHRLSRVFLRGSKGVVFDLVQVDSFGDEINVFYDKVAVDYDFILEKKRVFLNWRFSNLGRGRHQIVQAVKGGEILGYAVLGVREDDGYIEGQIEDLLALKERSDVVESLLSFACTYFDGLGINAVFYQVVEGHPYRRISEKMGFVNTRSRPTISFSYTEKYREATGLTEIALFKASSPERVYFGYAETV